MLIGIIITQYALNKNLYKFCRSREMVALGFEIVLKTTESRILDILILS